MLKLKNENELLIPLTQIKQLQDRGQEVGDHNKALREEIKVYQEERRFLAEEVARQIRQELELRERIKVLEEEIAGKDESLSQLIEVVQEGLKDFGI